MANVEGIRQAFGNLEYFRQNPHEINEEVEDWVDAIIEGWKRGYEVAVVDEVTAAMIKAGQTVDVASVGVYDLKTEKRLSEIPESELREGALQLLEDQVEKLAVNSHLLWTEADETSGETEAFFAFDVLEEEEEESE